MPGITATNHIAAPPEKVFDFATDLRNAPGRIKAIVRLEVLTEGPIRVGTRFRETRVMFKREAKEEMEITSFDPPRSYAMKAESHGCRYYSELRFTPNGSGTDVEMRFEAQPLSFFAKLMSVLMRPLMKMMVKACAKDLDDLKTAVETSA